MAVRDLYLIPKISEHKVIMIMYGSATLTPVDVISFIPSNGILGKGMDCRHTYLLINAGLLLLYLFFQSLQSGSIRCSAISFQHLNIPVNPISASVAKGT